MIRPITHRSLVILHLILISLFMAACGGGDGMSTADESAADMAEMEESFTPSEFTELEFMTHAAAGMAEQDIFTSASAEDEVLRLGAEDSLDAAMASTPLYRTAEAVEHDPFGLSEAPLGPFEKGESLGFTLGEWMAATGSGQLATDGQRGELELSFDKLIPNGVYTLWCSEIQMPPDFSATDRPCGAADGSQNGFIADATGEGSIRIPLEVLPVSGEGRMSVVALAYHSDDQDHGPIPGSFGSDTHVQLMYMVPMDEVAEAGR